MMKQHPPRKRFSQEYNLLCRQSAAQTLEEPPDLPEAVLQRMWRNGLFPEPLTSLEGHRLRVLSPGWLNNSGGPDFANAQIEFNGEVITGDVEIHRRMRDWFEHNHHADPAYNGVVLHVVSAPPEARAPRATTQRGRAVATLIWPDDAARYGDTVADGLPARCGKCASGVISENMEVFRQFLGLAGEWRMLEKQRRIRERMRGVGVDQAMYETFMEACGYSAYKEQFKRIARALPYERARQLAQQSPELLEVALLRIAGLFPLEWRHEVEPPLHYLRSLEHLQKNLPGLKALDLPWQSANCRPANRPERRIAGAARFIIRTADWGLHQKLEMLWRAPMTPVERRRAIEDLFGGATGFWANHCNWQGDSALRPSAPLGGGRIRTIIGNVLVPAALAWAREKNSTLLEDHVYDFFAAMPGETENRIHRAMGQWLFAGEKPFRMTFRQQQGLMQMHQDWCARNPSCRNCTLLAFLRSLENTTERG
jgi:hypothetical protein